MARPRIDSDAAREALLVAAERLIRRAKGATPSVKALAAECGMAPSNAYRFFPSKAALLTAVAARWFAEFETELTAAVSAEGDPMARLRAALEAYSRLMRARYHADPELFLAYLRLAEADPDLTRSHGEAVRAALRRALAQIAPGDAQAVVMVEDMTVVIRDPAHLAKAKGVVTDARLTALLDGVEAALRARLR